MTASKPEPQSRFTVSAGVSIGRFARRPIWRARYGASAEVWSTLPNTTWPTSAGSTPDRVRAASAAMAPRSVADRSLSAPPNAPKPVRAPARNTTPVSRPVAFTGWSSGGMAAATALDRKYSLYSNHGAIHHHRALGDDHQALPDVEVRSVQVRRLAV